MAENGDGLNSNAHGDPANRGFSRPLMWFCILGLLALTAAVCFLSCVPPVSRDALVHHLNVPKLYLQHGGMVEIPALPFSYFPMNLDLLYLIPLYFRNDILPKFIHFSFALLTAWVIFGYLKRRVDSAYALLGALFFLSIPVVVKLSITVYVDLGLAFFSLASFLMILRWAEDGFRWRHLVVAAVACGLGMGVKYNGLLVCFLEGLLVMLLFVRGNRDQPHAFRALAYGGGFVLIAALCMSPWLIRNAVWTGNPFYPLMQGLFGGRPTAGGEAISLLTHRRFIYGESWLDISLLPLRVFFQGRDGSGPYFDGRLNPFLLILSCLAFVGVNARAERIATEKKAFVFFCVLYFLFTLFSTILRVRYLLPIIPALVILSVFGLKNVIDLVHTYSGRFRKPLSAVFVAVLVLAMLLPNARYVYGQFMWVKPFQYLSGAVSREAYIARYRPEYPAMVFINRYLPADAMILFLFLGKRGYYCDRRYLLDDAGTRSILEEAAAGSQSASDVGDSLRRSGITHLLMWEGMFTRWVNESFDEDARGRLLKFLKEDTQVLFAQGGFVLIALRPGQDTVDEGIRLNGLDLDAQSGAANGALERP